MTNIRIAFVTSVVSLISCASSFAADKQATKEERVPPLSKCRSISIWAPSHSGWWLEIYPDGHGTLGYGSTTFDAAQFPAKTFEFDRVYRKLKKPAFAVGSIIASYSVTFRRKGASSNSAVYFKDERTIISLFEQAKRHVRGVADRKRFDNLWRKYSRLLPSTLEFRRLRGVWKIVSSKANGREVQGDVGRLWTFDGRELFLGPRTGRSKPMIVSIDVDKYPKQMAWDIPQLRLPKNWRDRPPLGRRGRPLKANDLPRFELVVPKHALFGYRLERDTLVVGYRISTKRAGREFRMRYVVPESLASDNGKYLLILRRVKRLPVAAPKPRTPARRPAK